MRSFTDFWQVNIGQVEIRNVPVYIRKFHNDGSTTGGLRFDGYIGLSLISKFLATIDYGKLTFSLTKDLDPPKIADAPEAVSLPLRLTSSGFLSGEVQLEGVESPLNFIVDTGASVSVISDEVAGLDAVSPSPITKKCGLSARPALPKGLRRSSCLASASVRIREGALPLSRSI